MHDMPLTMPSKALLGLVALSVLIAGTTAIAVVTNYELSRKAEHLVEEHAREFRMTERLRSQVDHLGAIRRAYLITQRPRYLAEYERASAGLQEMFGLLREVTHDERARALLDAVEEAVREHQRAWADLQEESAQPGVDVEALFSIRIDPTRDRLDAALEALSEEKKGRFLKATDETRLAASHALTILVGSGLLALALAAYLVFALRRILAREHAQRRLLETALQDVTEARAAQANFQNIREQLVEELRRSVETSKLFVGVVAHDLRNPLNAILMGTRALTRTTSDEDRARIVHRIIKSGDRMHRMIEQLLDFTQIRMGGALPTTPARCDLHTICREAIDEIQDAFEGARVTLDLKGDPVGSWDKARLEQALSNLLSNAVHHGIDGRADVEIDGSSRDRVLIRVHNLGVIPSDLLPAVFDPLQRGDSSSRGLGLGLFITKTIAQQHGGEVSVVSNRAVGTTFTLELPRRSVVAHEEVRPREAEARS
jgi:signal transduction histidine kinase